MANTQETTSVLTLLDHAADNWVAITVTIVIGLIINAFTGFFTRLFSLIFSRKDNSKEIDQPSVPVEITVKTEPPAPPTIAEPTANQIITVPRPNANYTGRAEKLDEVTAALGSGHVASIVSLGGMGGVGKTETAQVIAHRLLSEGKYPDGAVMLDLQGFSETGQMMETSTAIIRLFGQLKKTLGASPDDMSEEDYAATLGEMWRAETTGKDMLVILDNARDAEQARPLLPGAGATVLVTSRERIDLAGVREVTLDRLDDTDALALIRTLCPDLSVEDQRAFRQMADGLPLLIEVAAPVITADDGRSAAAKITAFAEVGAAEKGAAKLRARLALSLEALEPRDADFYAGLSQFEGGFFAQSAAEMWGEDRPDAERRLASFKAKNLLIPAETGFPQETFGARWRLHDHLRRAASDWLQTTPDQNEMLNGWRRAGLEMMRTAGALYNLHGDMALVGLALLDQELPNLRAVAADVGVYAAVDDVAAEVAMSLPNHGGLNLRLTATESISWLEAGIPGAQRLGDKGAEAMLLGNAGHRHKTRGDLDQAEQMYLKSLELQKLLDLKGGMASSYGNLGILYRIRGHFDLAESNLRASLKISDENGMKELSANQSGNLGNLYLTRGDLDQAEEMYLKSLELEKELGRKEGMASDYGNLGSLYQTRGDFDQAKRMYIKSLELNEALGREEGKASDYGNLGNLYQTRGDLIEAEEMYIKSLELNEALGRKGGMAIQRGNLAVLRLQQHRVAEALEHAETALGLFREVGMAPQVVQAEELVGKVRESM